MNKLALLVALASTSLSAMAAQSAITMENLTINKPIFWLTSGTAAPLSETTYVQVLGGPANATTLLPLTDATGTPVTMSIGFGGAPEGFFYGPGGLIPGTAGEATVQLQVIAWKGDANFAAATYTGKSEVWTQTDAGSWSTGTPPPPIAPSAALNMPNSFIITSVSVIPEPSTIALGLLGAAALLLRRRS